MKQRRVRIVFEKFAPVRRARTGGHTHSSMHCSTLWLRFLFVNGVVKTVRRPRFSLGRGSVVRSPLYLIVLLHRDLSERVLFGMTLNMKYVSVCAVSCQIVVFDVS
jgi:hypothetical protein